MKPPSDVVLANEDAALRARCDALAAEVAALADANARAADLVVELTESRAHEAALRRRTEEQEIQLQLARLAAQADSVEGLLARTAAALHAAPALGLPAQPVAYLWHEPSGVLRRVGGGEGAAELAVPSAPGSAELVGSALTLWLWGRERCVGALRMQVLADRSWQARWMSQLESFGALLGLALDRILGEVANERMAEQLALARDRALSASQAKSRMLANVSHELRTPLNAILGYAELMFDVCEETGQPELGGDLRRIIYAGRHLLGLIGDLLDLSQIETGRLELCPELVDLDELLEQVRAIVEPLARARSNQFSLSSPRTAPALVADPKALRQCLVNLIGNACKFTDHGTIDVRVTATPDEVAFAVEDTGIGIDDDQQARIFEAFVQAEDPEVRRRGGNGLGLSITRRLIELMNGRMELRSTVGRGSCFTLVLPRTPAQPPT